LANLELIRSIFAVWERGENGSAGSPQHVIADDPSSDLERRHDDDPGASRGDP
jgi:hypothetical protein